MTNLAPESSVSKPNSDGTAKRQRPPVGALEDPANAIPCWRARSDGSEGNTKQMEEVTWIL